jgi:O-acetyl-ADP-ribose deacetylase (regulator of RNase III)
MKEKIADLQEKSQPIRVIAGELLKQTDVDIIVSFLGEDLSWGGPVNQKLIAEAGHQLDEYVLEHILRPRAGSSFSTPAFTLPCKQLIFGIIPKWDAGFANEEKYLRRAIGSVLQLAETLGYSSIAIPAIGHGKNDVPLRKGARVIFSALRDLDLSAFDDVRIVCKSQDALEAYSDRFVSL